MKKIFLFIVALVCAGTLNLFAEDTRTVVSECSFTGWNPSIVHVGDKETDAGEALALTLKAPEGAPYYVSPTMLRFYKWDNATNQYKKLENGDTVTAGVYMATFQIRIDNSGNYYATGTEYGDHQYGYSHRFATDGMITYINGRKTEIYEAPTISNDYSYYFSQTPVFYVGMDGFKEDYYLPGKFAVNAVGDSIQFAQGNLQINPYYYFWTFAANQYDVIGSANATNIDGSNQDGLIDLFGWGTSGYNGKSPNMTSTTNTDYGDGATNDIAGTPYDWAVSAAEDMSLDGNWRTLTVDEWHYIINTRPNAAQLKAKATVVGQTGLILLPDNWDLTVLPLNTTDNAYTDNVLELSQWLAWEAQGAVFLPAAGYRVGTTYTKQTNETDFGAYWSSSNAVFTEDNPNYGQGAMALFIDWGSVAGLASGRRSRGYSVRLAREVPPTYKVTIVTENCRVTVEPESIDLNAVEQGTVLTLTAVPETNFRFKEWQNYNPETGLVVTSDTTITAICAKLWVVTKAEVTGGHVSITYWGTDHELTADELSSVPDGTRLTFTAIPDEGYRFVGWTPASAYASTTYIVNQAITYDFTVTPVFRRNGVFAVTIQRQYGGEVTCTTEGVNLEEVESGTKLTFKANPIAGWGVNRWAGSPNLVVNYETTPDIAELTVTTDETITCYFAELPPVEAIDDIQSEEKAVKFIRNGQLFILRGEKIYTVTGQEMR